jgi:hypothetical protein
VSHRRWQRKHLHPDNNRHEAMRRLRPKLRPAASIAGASLLLGCSFTEQSLGKPGSSTGIGDSAGSADPTEGATDDPDSEAEARWIGQELWASDGQPGDGFGTWALAVDGDTAVVGAPDHDGIGAAYVFVRTGNGWVEEQKLLPSDLAPVLAFGWSVAVDGDTIVVGAPSTLFPVEQERVDLWGAVYIFVRSDDGIWTEQQEILPSHGEQTGLGEHVALSGNTLIVDGTFFAREEGGAWSERQTAQVGGRVVMNGGWAVLGHVVYLRTGDQWSPFQELSFEGKRSHPLGCRIPAPKPDLAEQGTWSWSWSWSWS